MVGGTVVSKHITFIKARGSKINVYTPPGHNDIYKRRLLGPVLIQNVLSI